MYAWIKQIVSSNRTYILIAIMYNKNVLILIEIENDVIRDNTISVSYTHLTLPTNREV